MEADLNKPDDDQRIVGNNPYLDFDHIIEQRKAAGVTLEYLSRISKEVSEYDPYVRPMEPDDFRAIEKDMTRGIHPHTVTYARLMGTDIAIMDREVNVPPLQIKGEPAQSIPKGFKKVSLNAMDTTKWVIRRIDVYMEDLEQYRTKLEGHKLKMSSDKSVRAKAKQLLKTIIPFRRYTMFVRKVDEQAELFDAILKIEEHRKKLMAEEVFSKRHMLAIFRVRKFKRLARKALSAKRKLFEPTLGNS
jgi:hypothetical protein